VLIPYRGQRPQVDSSALIQPSAQIIGNVCIGAESSLWFNVVARGDINCIRIGRRTNVQDGTVIHVCSDRSVIIGNEVTIGHNATIHGCTIGDGCLIGMGSIILVEPCSKQASWLRRDHWLHQGVTFPPVF